MGVLGVFLVPDLGFFWWRAINTGVMDALVPVIPPRISSVML